jgi:hypothetical protein
MEKSKVPVGIQTHRGEGNSLMKIVQKTSLKLPVGRELKECSGNAVSIVIIKVT